MEITLDQFKGSNIEKGFNTESKAPSFNEKELVVRIASNFQKGLIEQDLFEKAIDDINSIGLNDVEKGTVIEMDKQNLVKGEKGWEFAKKDDDKKDGEDDKGDKDKKDEVKKADGGDSDDDEGSMDKGGDTKDVAEGGKKKDDAATGEDAGEAKADAKK